MVAESCDEGAMSTLPTTKWFTESAVHEHLQSGPTRVAADAAGVIMAAAAERRSLCAIDLYPMVRGCESTPAVMPCSFRQDIPPS